MKTFFSKSCLATVVCLKTDVYGLYPLNSGSYAYNYGSYTYQTYPPPPVPVRPPTTSSVVTSPDNCDIPVLVNVTTDNYHNETSWDIVDVNGNTTVVSGGDYAEAHHSYIDDSGVLSCGHEYRFTIRDSYGDGICCWYGEGGYVVKVGDELVAAGGEFSTEESTEFTIEASV